MKKYNIQVPDTTIGTLVAVGIALLVIALLIGMIVGWPLAVIWAVNTLFNAGWEYSIVNWLAIMVLHIILSGLLKLKVSLKD